MKKLSLTALLMGAALFTALGTTTLSAKCGGAEASKCGGEKAAKCGSDKKAAKCGGDKAAKCGGDKKAPKAAEKCGAGKCG